jgi:Flp pilus assembly protein TadB
MTEQERMAEKIRESILRSDEESAADAEFPLPQEVENRRLFWEERPADAGLSILLFAGIVAVLAAAVMRSRLHEKVERRERQMLLDYPQIISKFVLYLGAGLSIRSTFTRLGEAYQKGREEGKEERGAYEEILRVCRELSSGVPETEAYARFGQRCRSRQYARLSTLLTQNLRKGNQELLSVMQQEAQASYEERRNMARKLGEEAETKLLLPMIMMLTITMLIIIIPAYYSFAM